MERKERVKSVVVDKIPETARLIKGTVDQWVDIDGSIYCIDTRNSSNSSKVKIIKKTLQTLYGYKVCGIKYPDGIRHKRVHILVAEAFIPNPDNLPIVGHRNNIKSDNRVENLYWTTIKENTQKAVDDGLVVNKKGIEDSQSMPVKMYETKTNKLLGVYGSASEAAKETGIGKNTILRQAKYKRPVRRDYYFRFIDDEDCCNSCIGVFDYDSDREIKRYVNVGQASCQLDVPPNTIRQQLKAGKPKYKTRDFYFKIINVDKCEQTIES